MFVSYTFEYDDINGSITNDQTGECVALNFYAYQALLRAIECINEYPDSHYESQGKSKNQVLLDTFAFFFNNAKAVQVALLN